MIRRRAILHLAVVALLLFAQHGALTHALAHVHGGQPAQAQHHDGGKQGSPSGACAFHISFAQVFGAIASCGMALHVTRGSEVPGLRRPLHAYSPILLVPESRAPPPRV